MEPKYLIRDEDQQYLDWAFTYHSPKADQPERYAAIRDQFRSMAKMLIEQCPPSRERSVALTQLETASFWANASIARNESSITMEGRQGRASNGWKDTGNLKKEVSQKR